MFWLFVLSLSIAYVLNWLLGSIHICTFFVAPQIFLYHSKIGGSKRSIELYSKGVARGVEAGNASSCYHRIMLRTSRASCKATRMASRTELEQLWAYNSAMTSFSEIPLLSDKS
jgi:hypothetical protein